jgi:hypothetical protein
MSNKMARPAIVSLQELELFREDPDREKKLLIFDYVVCRKCGAQLSLIFKLHLARDGYASIEQYQRQWKDAPIYSIRDEAEKQNWYFDHKADAIAAASQRNKDHPKRHKKAQKKYRGTARGKQKAKARRDKRNQLVKELLQASRSGVVLPFPHPQPAHSKKPPHRPRKDEEAEVVDRLKNEGLSWRQVAIKMNLDKSAKDQRTADAYRSLWRAWRVRHPLVKTDRPFHHPW